MQEMMIDQVTGEIIENNVSSYTKTLVLDTDEMQEDLGYKLADLEIVKQMNNDMDELNSEFAFSKIVVHSKQTDQRYGLTDFECEVNGLSFSGTYSFENNKHYAIDALHLENVEAEDRRLIDIDKLKNELYLYSRRKNKTLLYNESGLPMIAERRFFLFGKFNTLYVYPLHEHSIIFGGSGSGKTQSLVFPLIKSILDARENAVIHDCKLELFDHFGKQFLDAGYNVIVLNYANPIYSHRYNPFKYPIKLWKETLEENNCNCDEWRKCKTKGLSKSIERFKDVAQLLCYEEDNDRNSYFWKGAGRMMAGAALLLAEEGRFECINGKGIQMVYGMDEADEKRDSILREFLGECRNIDDESVIQIGSYLDADPHARGSISSTFKQKIEVLSMNDDIRYITADSDFDLEDIYEKQTVVFVLTQDEKTQYYPLVTLFLKQLYEVGVGLTRDGKYTTWPYKMNWIMEEMGILPEVKDFKNIYNAARSRGLTIYGFMQSMADAIDKYEMTGTKTILENCRMHVMVHAETEDTFEHFIKRCGDTLTWDRKAANGKGDWRAVPMFTKNKLRSFEKGRILFAPAETDPYVAKLPRYNQYVFYQKPIVGYVYSDEMFGSKGRQYDVNDIPWFSEMETLTLKHKFLKEHVSD